MCVCVCVSVTLFIYTRNYCVVKQSVSVLAHNEIIAYELEKNANRWCKLFAVSLYSHVPLSARENLKGYSLLCL